MSGGNFLTPKEQIKHCEAKGIQFNDISKNKAIHYLESNNNYFKLRSFRKNFTKDLHQDKYINLDFADLIDLAIIDNRLRKILLEMSLNLEHFSKVHLLKILQENKFDAYEIISDYFAQLSPDNLQRLKSDLNKNKGSVYCGNLYNKYMVNNPIHCPVWVFIEIISFGQYLHFYNFCASQTNSKELKLRMYLMRTVKDLRNACAHNNCIINDLRAKLPPSLRPNLEIINALSKIGLSKGIRRKHLYRAPFYQIITTFYAHNLIVSSTGVHNKICNDLTEFKNRLY
ncbi:Abi family protein [Veillonella criceti]|uniref:Abortive infection bacteriophage resistance protein n=1 Tax=Veillonella criceti TaxID=103891 RepID=A0A380NM67_9FIRM|nr:Abi family protein [Veillonella criceti]SUP44187.1 Abortive infection bacteriophage resistance protein [Veillonella criceti]